MSTLFVLGRENVPCVAEVVNRSLKADCTDFTDFTTSSLFEIGKGSSLKMLRENEHFRKNAEIFNQYNATSKEIRESEKILLSYQVRLMGNFGLNSGIP